jgi:E3 ubiquitin-protein ligase TRIP12
VCPASAVELCAGGAEREVTRESLGEFVALIERRTVELPEIVAQFRRGLSTIVPWEFQRLFTRQEICLVIAGDRCKFAREDFVHVKTGHGYDAASPQVGWLFEILLEMSAEQQALFVLFVQFVTGSPNLPFGGLAALEPPITVAVRVPERADQRPDETLPSVMTCTNYFKVPEYSSKDIMKERVLRAINDGQGAFALS